MPLVYPQFSQAYEIQTTLQEKIVGGKFVSHKM